MDAVSSPEPFRFGRYELDRQNGELRRNRVPMRIQDKPLRLLLMLAERPGVLVTRAELQKRLWPDNTFVDFEDGLNTAVRKLRETLGDQADRPRYIETVPRRGYRFIADLESCVAPVAPAVGPAPQTFPRSPYPATQTSVAPGGPGSQTPDPAGSVRPASAAASSSPVEPPASAFPPAHRGKRRAAWVAAPALVILVAATTAWLFRARTVLSSATRNSVLIADFDNQTGDARFDKALETAFRVSLEQSQSAHVFPLARISSVLHLMGQPPDARITPELGREICQRENIGGLIACAITRAGQEYAITAELIDPASGETVRSYSERSYGEDHILDALDVIAADIRHDLGESLYQIHVADRPLPEVTTASLTALHDYADGQALWHSGHFNSAMTLFCAAVAADSSFAMAHAALASGYCSYLYWQLADCQREYAAALAPTAHVSSRERMIIAASQADDLDHLGEAATLYQAYLEHYPNDWTMLSSYAHLLRLHGRASEAIDQYRRILRIAPDDARAYVELATASQSQGQSPQALRAYDEAFKLEPQWLTAGNVNREYGFTLVRSGAPQKAEQVFTAELANPVTREDGLRSLGLLDLWEGRYARARPQLEQALQIDQEQRKPFGQARVHYLLAVAAAGEGDRAGQLAQLDAAMADFRHLEAKVQFGSLVGQEYARAGALAKAERLDNLIIPLADLRNREQAGYLRLLHGEILVAQDHANQAIGVFGLPDPSDGLSVMSLTTEALAHAYQQAGRRDEAADWYAKLLAHNGLPGWEPQQRIYDADYELASDDLARGDYAQAQAALAQLLSAWKDGDATLPLRRRALALEARLSAPAPPSGSPRP